MLRSMGRPGVSRIRLLLSACMALPLENSGFNPTNADRWVGALAGFFVRSVQDAFRPRIGETALADKVPLALPVRFVRFAVLRGFDGVKDVHGLI